MYSAARKSSLEQAIREDFKWESGEQKAAGATFPLLAEFDF